MGTKRADDEWEDIPDETRARPRPSRDESAAAAAQEDEDDWEDMPEREENNEFESGLYGAGAGASLDFDDEIVGAVRSLLGPETYKKARDEWREKKKHAREDNPKSYLAGELTGGVAAGLAIPGSGVARGASAVSKIGRAALSGAAVGAGAGLGASESEDMLENLKDTGRGAALGGAGGAALSGAAQAVGKGLSAAGRVTGLAEKGFKALGEIPDHIAERIKADPGIVQRSKSVKASGELTDDLAREMNKLQASTRDDAEKAWRPLIELDRSGESLVPGSQLATLVAQDVGKSYNLFDSPQGAQKRALAKLKDAATETSKVRSFQDLKRVVQAIDENINWDSQSDQLANEVLQSYRTKLDQTLKKASPAYREAMGTLSDKMGTLQQLRVKFGLKKGSETVGDEVRPRLLPTDRSITSVETALSQTMGEKGAVGRKAMQKHLPGFHRDLEDAGMGRYLERDIGRGSRSTMVFGGVLGTLFGGNTLPGVAIGYLRDKEGRRIAAQGLASLAGKSAYVRSQAKNLGGPFSNLLEEAAKRGGNAAVMVTAKMMAEKSPEYRQALEEGLSGDDEDQKPDDEDWEDMEQ